MDAGALLAHLEVQQQAQPQGDTAYWAMLDQVGQRLNPTDQPPWLDRFPDVLPQTLSALRESQAGPGPERRRRRMRS